MSYVVKRSDRYLTDDLLWSCWPTEALLFANRESASDAAEVRESARVVRRVKRDASRAALRAERDKWARVTRAWHAGLGALLVEIAVLAEIEGLDL